MRGILNLLFFVAVFTLNSCMSTATLDLIKPADVNISSEIKHFAVIQRNEAKKGDKLAKRVEGLFSGEGIGTDKRSAGYALNGLILQLSRSPRFTIKSAQTTLELYGTGTRKMAEPLDWYVVREICESNNADALIVIEAFDSDVRRNVSERDVTRKVSGGEVTERVYESRLRVDVEVGWRIYYPDKQIIVDNYSHQKSNTRRASGDSEVQSRRNLPGLESIVKLTASQLGEEYGRRISPSRVTVKRLYYGSGSSALKQGKQKIIQKNYDEAIGLWQNEYEFTLKQKLKGKCAYNLALAYELKGDYKNALYWIEQAIQNQNKKARRYLNILQERVEEERRLKDQMGDEDFDF